MKTQAEHDLEKYLGGNWERASRVVVEDLEVEIEEELLDNDADACEKLIEILRKNYKITFREIVSSMAQDRYDGMDEDEVINCYEEITGQAETSDEEKG